MDGERLLHFFDFCLEDEKEDSTEVEQALKDAGINIEGSEKKTMELIWSAKAEVKIKQGEELQKRFDSALSEKTTVLDADGSNYNYRVAARNFEGLTEEDMKLMRENLAALERCKKGNPPTTKQ